MNQESQMNTQDTRTSINSPMNSSTNSPIPTTAPETKITMPVAIIVAGALIAGAVLWNKPASLADGSKNGLNGNGGANSAAVRDAAKALEMSDEAVLVPVTPADHIFGNPNAPIKIVEYSDMSCPFCKSFHKTMNLIMSDYGKSGKVAWVYRHYPLDKDNGKGFILHPNAGKEAQASECVAELGGNDAFWKFINRLYEITPSVTQATPEGLDPAQLPIIAEFAGVNRAKFEACLSSGKYATKVEADFMSGVNAGVSATPTSFIVPPKGSNVPIIGGLPIKNVKAAIDALLNVK